MPRPGFKICQCFEDHARLCARRAVQFGALILLMVLFEGASASIQPQNVPAERRPPDTAATLPAAATSKPVLSSASQPSETQPTSQPAGDAPDAFPKVVALEERGDFDAAAALFYREQLAARHKDHMQRLEAVRTSEALADRMLKDGQYAAAREALTGVQKSLDGFDDRGLQDRLRLRLNDVDKSARTVADANARDLLALARKRRKARRYSEASGYCQQVLDLNLPATPSVRILQSAKALKEKIEQDKANVSLAGTASQLVDSTMTGLRTVAGWLLIGAPFVLSVLGIRWLVRYSPRPGARLDVKDMSVPDKDRDGNSQLLTTELSLRLQAFGAPALGRPELDGSPDLDSTGMPNVAIDHSPTTNWLPLATETVRVGPFSLSPAALWQLGKTVFDRPYQYELSGWLLSPEKGILLAVNNERRRGHLAGMRWQCSHEGEDARASAIREMILKIAFEMGKEGQSCPITGVWDSFRPYHEARDLMESARHKEDRKNVLENARDLLRQATQADPANWIAWFYLATVLRKLGQNRESAEHFRFLIELLGRPPQTLAEYLELHPDFEWVLWHNLAVCLSKIDDDWDAHREAMDILAGLVKALD